MKKQNLVIAVALAALALPASFAVAGEAVEAATFHPIADVDIADPESVRATATGSSFTAADLAFDPILDADFVDNDRAWAAACTGGRPDLSFHPIVDVENL